MFSSLIFYFWQRQTSQVNKICERSGSAQESTQQRNDDDEDDAGAQLFYGIAWKKKVWGVCVWVCGVLNKSLYYYHHLPRFDLFVRYKGNL